jgi:ADP-glucose pyrophosphorylase
MKTAEVDADVLNNSEELTAMWIQAYLEEIKRVESFFSMKMDMLVDEFILM